jgi:hypothetical protein
MNQKELLEKLHRAQDRMEKDHDNGLWGKYPPLYSSDYLFGRIKVVKETIQLIEGYDKLEKRRSKKHD